MSEDDEFAEFRPTPEQRKADRAALDAATARLVAESDEHKRATFPPGTDVLQTVAEWAGREISAWQAYPCRGSSEHISRCSEDSARTCDRSKTKGCPRRTVLGEGWQLCQAAIASGFDENAIYEWSGFDAYGRLRPTAPAPRWVPAVRKTVESFAAGRYLVVLSGETGTGKTMAAAMLALIKRSRMVTASTVLGLSRFDGSFEALCRVPALVVDDLGTEYLDVKGEAAARWDDLFNARYRQARMFGHPTVMTCNLTAKDFSTRYGARAADRVREVGAFIEVGGTSMRRRAP